MTCRALNAYTCDNPTPSGQTLSYDALRRLVAWQGSSSSEQYAYDGEGNRVWRQTTSGATTTTTVSILGVEDVTSVSGGATTATRYYALPGGVTATRDSSGLVYEATDALGTPIASLNLSTGMVGEQLRAPYGQARYAANATGSGGGMRTPYGFTGQREDTSPSGASGLDDFNARMYDSVTGRFTSADDAQPGLGDPGGQDNYAYVGGMVENATDPSGHAYAEDALGQPAENAGPVVPDVTSYININLTEHGGAVAMLTGVSGGGAADAVDGVMGNGVLDVSSADTVTVNADGSVSITTNPEGADPVMGAELDSEKQFNTEMTDAQRTERVPTHDTGSDTPPPSGPDTPPGGSHGPDTAPTGADTSPTNTGDSNPLEGCSFSADTPVATPGGGERAIGSLRVGDPVEAYNSQTGKTEAESIQHVWVNHDSDLVDVRVSVNTAGSTQATTTTPPRTQASGHGWLADDKTRGVIQLRTSQETTTNADASETIHTTANHPWLTADRGWVVAGDLRVGEHVIELAGRTATVMALAVRPGDAYYYNLTVSQLHTFAVGSGQYVVHNTNCPSGFDYDAASQSGTRADKGGLTRAGREYQKHMGRGELPSVRGSNLDNAGQNLLDDILTDPNADYQHVTGGGFAGGHRIIGNSVVNGRFVGATFDSTGLFQYFGVYP